MSSTHRSPGARPHAPDQVLGDPLDGRLNLDDLDAPLDLESIADDNDDPYLSERLRTWLEEQGVLAWARRHRVILASASAVALVAATVGGIAYARRPVPLPAQPRLVLTSSGADADQVQIDTTRATPTLTLSLVLTSAEARGVTMRLLGLTGPGLVENPDGIEEDVDPALPDRPLRSTARISCADAAAFDAVVSATPSDYGVFVRRTSPGGDSRVDTVPLRGGIRLSTVVKQECVQAIADRQLAVRSVQLAPLADSVGLSMQITVDASSDNAWNIERVVASPGSAITSGDIPTFAARGRPAVLDAELHPSDCAHPLRDIADGLPIQAAPAGSTLDGGAGTQVLLQLPGSTRRQIVDALALQCGTRPVTSHIDQVIVHAGASADSGGTLELRMHLAAPDAFVLPIDDVTSAAGRVHPEESPASLVAGVATVVITWDVPPCARLARTGTPDLTVRAVVVTGDQVLERPYRLPLGGDELRLGITRLCGDSVAAQVLASASDPVLTH
jgi:hypothetical protein